MGMNAYTPSIYSDKLIDVGSDKILTSPMEIWGILLALTPKITSVVCLRGDCIPLPALANGARGQGLGA